jgi:hypothetical protein
MTPHRSQFTLSATALAASLMLAACGGGDAEPPADIVPPTLAISDNVAAATATGDVTFTFTFNETVGSSFTADDVAVSGGTKGAFTMAPDGLSATLVAVPAAGATGTLRVDVASGAFSDAAGNASTTAYTAAQDYDTVVAGPGSGATGTCTAATCIDFAAAGIGFGPFENQGGGTVMIANDPNDAANKVVEFVKKPGDGDYFGTTITGIGPFTLTADNKTITLRVLAPAAGTNFLLKLEGGVGGPAVTEKDVVTTLAGQWETLSFVMPDAATYSTVVLFPNGRSAVATNKTMYVDELKFPPAAPVGGACSAPDCVDFSAAGIGFGPFENGGGGTVEIATDPANAANKLVKFVKKAGDGDYFGTTITGLGVNAVLTAGAKTVTMRVFSPAAGTNFLLKFEGGVGGPATTEKDVVTTKSGEWETLSFEMPDVGTYSTVVVFPHGRSAVSSDTVMYIDDLSFPDTVASGGGGGGGGFIGGVFADDYVGTLPATAKSTQGGDVGFFFDDRLFATKSYDYGGVSGTAQDPAGVHNFYYGIGLNAPAITDAYFGAYVRSPGNASVDVSAFTNIKVNVWGPDQLFKAGSFPALNVVLQGPAVAGCGSASGGSEVERTFTTTTQGAASIYTLPLAGFTLKFACSGETTVAQVLAHIAQFNVVLKNTNIQYVNKDPDGVAFTNGLNVGSIKFD